VAMRGSLTCDSVGWVGVGMGVGVWVGVGVGVGVWVGVGVGVTWFTSFTIVSGAAIRCAM
jgi:hypothetical protein